MRQVKDAPREGRKGYSDRAVNEVSMFLDAPREGHMGYSHGMMVQYINDLRCAPRGAHGLQSVLPRPRWVGAADAPREGRMGYSRQS